MLENYIIRGQLELHSERLQNLEVQSRQGATDCSSALSSLRRLPCWRMFCYSATECPPISTKHLNGRSSWRLTSKAIPHSIFPRRTRRRKPAAISLTNS